MALSPFVTTTKIDWAVLARILSKRVKREIHPVYVRDLYNGYNKSKALLEEIHKILKEYDPNFVPKGCEIAENIETA